MEVIVREVLAWSFVILGIVGILALGKLIFVLITGWEWVIKITLPFNKR